MSVSHSLCLKNRKQSSAVLFPIKLVDSNKQDLATFCEYFITLLSTAFHILVVLKTFISRACEVICYFSFIYSSNFLLTSGCMFRFGVFLPICLNHHMSHSKSTVRHAVCIHLHSFYGHFYIPRTTPLNIFCTCILYIYVIYVM